MLLRRWKDIYLHLTMLKVKLGLADSFQTNFKKLNEKRERGSENKVVTQRNKMLFDCFTAVMF